MGDDALGPYFVRLLESRWRFPEGVRILDLGTPGPELVQTFQENDAVLVVDTVKGSDPPGSIRIFERDGLAAGGPEERLTPHDPSLRQALLTAELVDDAPEVVTLVGVVPERVELGTGMTAAVRAALEGVEREIVQRLSELGVTPERRTDGSPPDFWWERPTGPRERE